MAHSPPGGGNWFQCTGPRKEIRERFHAAADTLKAEVHGERSSEGFRRYPCRDSQIILQAVLGQMTFEFRKGLKAKSQERLQDKVSGILWLALGIWPQVRSLQGVVQRAGGRVPSNTRPDGFRNLKVCQMVAGESDSSSGLSRIAVVVVQLVRCHSR